jgi:hypothetical protein
MHDFLESHVEARHELYARVRHEATSDRRQRKIFAFIFADGVSASLLALETLARTLCEKCIGAIEPESGERRSVMGNGSRQDEKRLASPALIVGERGTRDHSGGEPTKVSSFLFAASFERRRVRLTAAVLNL